MLLQFQTTIQVLANTGMALSNLVRRDLAFAFLKSKIGAGIPKMIPANNNKVNTYSTSNVSVPVS
jgi:hypothetical protein